MLSVNILHSIAFKMNILPITQYYDKIDLFELRGLYMVSPCVLCKITNILYETTLMVEHANVTTTQLNSCIFNLSFFFFFFLNSFLCSLSIIWARAVQIFNPRKKMKKMLDGFGYRGNWSARNSPIGPIQWIIQTIVFIFHRHKSNNKRIHNKVLFTISNASRNFKSPVRNDEIKKKSTTHAIMHTILTVLNSISLYFLYGMSFELHKVSKMEKIQITFLFKVSLSVYIIISKKQPDQ